MVSDAVDCARRDAVGRLLEAGRTVARLARHVELALQPLELTLAQYRVLCALDSGAEASSSLAEKLAVSAPSITTVVDGLVARGLVDRSHDAGPDRRRVSISLTEDGRRVADTARHAVAERFSGLLGRLDASEGADLVLDGLELWAVALDRDRDAGRAGRRTD
jgi:DNA-binding MarR family transcriptional regulator